MKALILLTLIIIGFTSCEKVIDVDLNEANPVIAIEGSFSAEDSTVRVKISLTANYFGTNQPASVSDATVTIIDQNGITSSVPLIGDGYYELQNYIPSFNTVYTLNVVHNGQSYSAQCKLFSAVPLNPLSYEYFPSFFGSDPGYAVFLNFDDPIGIENYYQIVLTKNDTTLNTIPDYYTQDDQLTDGNTVSRPLFTLFDIADTIDLEFRSIDKKVYDYINEIQATIGGNSSAPANPTSNWSNKALGYFNAYSSSKGSIIIQ
jgi:hypothetical protein